MLNTYFDGIDKLKMKDLKIFMKIRKSEVQKDIDAIKLIEIYIFGRMLLGRESSSKVVYGNYIMILEDEFYVHGLNGLNYLLTKL